MVISPECNASCAMSLDPPGPRERVIDQQGAPQHEPLRDRAPVAAIRAFGTVVAEAEVMPRLDVIGLAQLILHSLPPVGVRPVNVLGIGTLLARRVMRVAPQA